MGPPKTRCAGALAGLTVVGMQTLALTVRPAAVDDDEQMRQWYAITEAAETYERPWATTWTLTETLVQFRAPDAAMRWIPYAVFDGDEMVGASFSVMPLHDNTEKLYAAVFVAPQERNRGVGSALVEHLVQTARSEGRSTLLIAADVPGSDRENHPYVRFARKHGFRTANVEVHRVLDLPVDEGVLAAMAAEAAEHHGGYEILTFEDEVPEHLLDSYLHLLSQLALDAPSGDVDFEAETVTRETHAQGLEKMRAQGRHRLVTLAVSPDGEAVAHSDLVVRADHPQVHQWGTLVRRDHRGHHLGAAVKIANLRALQQRYPDRRTIHTTNAETNATMIGINERLGFRVVEICPEFVREV